jgi:monoamine oxidase
LSSQVSYDYDVVIAGAGLSGLAAADYIKNDNALRIREMKPPVSFVLLEGSERPGGRTYTVPNVPGYLDVGGAYVAPTQSYVRTMLERFGIETFDTWLPDDKLNVYEPELGAVQPFEGNYPLTPGVRRFLLQVETEILAIRAHVTRPWETHRAAERDALSVQEWMDQNLPMPVGQAALDEPTSADILYCRELLTIAVRSAFSVEPDEISWFYLLTYGAACGTFRAFEDVKGGGDAIRIAKGSQELVRHLEQAVDPKHIRYQADIEDVVQDAEATAITYKAANGTRTTVVAKRLIVAMSPGATSYIRFDPPLSVDRQELVKGAPMAATIKGFLLFDRAWWREKFSGYVLSARGPADWIMDNTWKDPADGVWKYPALMTFIVGKQARDLTRVGEEARKAALLDQLERVFGWDRTKNPCKGYKEKDWLADNWSFGCPAGCLKKGILTRYGKALRAPEGLIHWAGSEAATDWMAGYMNGAIQSGIRAAGEVLEFL